MTLGDALLGGFKYAGYVASPLFVAVVGYGFLLKSNGIPTLFRFGVQLAAYLGLVVGMVMAMVLVTRHAFSKKPFDTGKRR